MVDGVADEVKKRVTQSFVDRLVDADVLALDLDPDLLPDPRCEVAHDPAELSGDRPHGLETGPHHTFLELARDDAQLPEREREGSFVVVIRQLADLAAGEHQLADQVHEVVQHGHVDTHGGLDRVGRWLNQRD